jgi:endonuclease/exonuclease/phosphatase family metal-dependent hydrolase
MRLRALLIGVVVAVTALTMPAVEAIQSDGRRVELRVASYNIAAGAGAGGFDVERQIETLRAIDADILSLQEVDVHWSERSQWRDLATEIADGLDMHVFFGHIYDLDPPAEGEPRREFGIALLSSYPIVSAKNHWITRLSTQTPNPVPEPAPGFPEIVVNARGALVHVYGTHLDYRPDPAVREMQVADMLEIMARDRRGRRILMGDLNATPDAPELAPLWRRHADAWRAADETGDGFTYPAASPDRRIDYVAVSRRVRVRDVCVPETLASDHRPVVADLVVSRGWH